MRETLYQLYSDRRLISRIYKKKLEKKQTKTNTKNAKLPINKWANELVL